MKRCSQCKQYKPENEFSPKQQDSPELKARCKSCVRKRAQQSRQRNLLERRQQDRERYRLRRLSGWKPTLTPEQKLRKKQRVKDHPERIQAKTSVREAVIRGKRIIADISVSPYIRGEILIKPLFCQTCGSRRPPEKIHGHHFLGYGPDERLKVFFVCSNCHQAISTLEKDAVQRGFPAIAGLAMFIRKMVGAEKSSSPVLQEDESRVYNAQSGIPD